MKFISLAAVFLAAAVILGSTPASGSPGFTPVKLRAGVSGPAVTELQMFLRLNTRGNFFRFHGGFTDYFGPVTTASLVRWQSRTGFPATGWIVIGSRQWNQLRQEVMKFHLPAGIDVRAVGGARQDGWAIDASKHTGMMYVLRYSAAKRQFTAPLSTPTSFGGCNSDGCFVTPNGAFAVFRKAGRYEVSRQWKDSQGNPAPMPYSLYFTGGVAVHYDPLGNSHECVHVPSWSLAEYLYYHFPLGGLVVVH